MKPHEDNAGKHENEQNYAVLAVKVNKSIQYTHIQRYIALGKNPSICRKCRHNFFNVAKKMCIQNKLQM